MAWIPEHPWTFGLALWCVYAAGRMLWGTLPTVAINASDGERVSVADATIERRARVLLSSLWLLAALSIVLGARGALIPIGILSILGISRSFRERATKFSKWRRSDSRAVLDDVQRRAGLGALDYAAASAYVGVNRVLPAVAAGFSWQELSSGASIGWAGGVGLSALTGVVTAVLTIIGLMLAATFRGSTAFHMETAQRIALGAPGLGIALGALLGALLAGWHWGSLGAIVGAALGAFIARRLPIIPGPHRTAVAWLAAEKEKRQKAQLSDAARDIPS